MDLVFERAPNCRKYSRKNYQSTVKMKQEVIQSLCGSTESDSSIVAPAVSLINSLRHHLLPYGPNLSLSLSCTALHHFGLLYLISFITASIPAVNVTAVFASCFISCLYVPHHHWDYATSFSLGRLCHYINIIMLSVTSPRYNWISSA